MNLLYYKWLFERLRPHMLIECSANELLHDLFTTWFRLPKTKEVRSEFQNTIRTMLDWGILRVHGKNGNAIVYTPVTKRINQMNSPYIDGKMYKQKQRRCAN